MSATPMMQQVHDAKASCPGALLLFRMGDFYELFHEDAQTAARVLGLALTSRDKNDNPTPMAGFPYHQLESYLGKLINAGLRVAAVTPVRWQLCSVLVFGFRAILAPRSIGYNRSSEDQSMKIRVTKTGLNIPPEFLKGLDEVEIRQEQNRVVIVPVTVADPLRTLGVTPVDEAISDASVNHDLYLSGK